MDTRGEGDQDLVVVLDQAPLETAGYYIMVLVGRAVMIRTNSLGGPSYQVFLAQQDSHLQSLSPHPRYFIQTILAEPILRHGLWKKKQ